MEERTMVVLSTPSTPAAQQIDVIRQNDSAKRRPLACANYTELLDSIQKKKKRRRSIEALLDSQDPHRVAIPRGDNGSYGFNLRGSLLVRGHNKQRGQYIRSVDFNGPAHVWGLRAGDRVLAVNNVVCEEQRTANKRKRHSIAVLGVLRLGPTSKLDPYGDVSSKRNVSRSKVVAGAMYGLQEDHDFVIELIRKTPKSKNLELVVVSDPNMKGTAQTATSGLLKTKAKEVINEKTGIPHFTVEMTEQPLGRTKMLQRKIFGSPMINGGRKSAESTGAENMVDSEQLSYQEFRALHPLSDTERDTPSPDLDEVVEDDGKGNLWV